MIKKKNDVIGIKKKKQINQKLNNFENDSCYQMKLNRALFLYKSIEYTEEKMLKRFLRNTEVVSQFLDWYFQYILQWFFIVVFDYKSCGPNEKISKNIIESAIFPVVIFLFTIYFEKLDEEILKEKYVEKELYEIALDIYDTLCLDQNNQDKKNLKNYIDKHFLNRE